MLPAAATTTSALTPIENSDSSLLATSSRASACPSQCNTAPKLHDIQTSFALRPATFHTALVVRSAGSVSGVKVVPSKRQTNPVAANWPPTNHRSEGELPQMPNTMLVPGVVSFSNVPFS